MVIPSTDGSMPPCTSISSLPSELLLKIFEFCRLHDEYDWNHKRRWYKPLHACRRWRYVILESASRLKLRLLCTKSTPVAEMLMHSPLLPLRLIVDFDLHPIVPPPYRETILLALQHHDRVSSISVWLSDLRQRSLGNMEMFMALDKSFPNLEALALSSQDCMTRALPNNFMAPRLRSLHLRTVDVSAVSSLLTNATNLISLTIACILTYDCISPEYLVELLSSLPQLERLSISTRFSSAEVRELQHTPITRVMLPRLWRFKYMGVSAYLENLLSLISAPSLQSFNATFLDHCSSTFPRLSEFLCTIQNLDFGTAEVSIHPTKLSITYVPAQPSASLPCFSFNIQGVHDESGVATAVQICSATTPALQSVQDLVLDFDETQASLIQNAQWHALLQLFGAVRMLMTGVTLTAGLFEALHPDNGAATKGLLPRLSKLVVVSEDDPVQVHGPLLSFIHTYRLAGRHIDYQVIKQWPPPFSGSGFDYVSLFIQSIGWVEHDGIS